MKKLNLLFSRIIKEIRYRTIMRSIKNGKIFSATFTKTDGSIRVMSCRTGVRKGLKGKGLGYDPRKNRNIIVWDMNANGYRTIKTDRLKCISIQGKTYNFEQI